jgi:hypothetical protein
MLTIKNEYKEKVLKRHINLKEKTPKNNGGLNYEYLKTNNENYKSNIYLAKYASNLKRRLAKKHMNAKSQPNKDNVKKKKKVIKILVFIKMKKEKKKKKKIKIIFIMT